MPHQPLLPLTGRFWRMLGVRWQRRPYDSGSHLTGGRWNPVGTPVIDPSRPLAASPATMPAAMPAEKHKRPQVERFLPTRRRIDREINKLKFAHCA